MEYSNIHRCMHTCTVCNYAIHFNLPGALPVPLYLGLLLSQEVSRKPCIWWIAQGAPCGFALLSLNSTDSMGTVTRHGGITGYSGLKSSCQVIMACHGKRWRLIRKVMAHVSNRVQRPLEKVMGKTNLDLPTLKPQKYIEASDSVTQLQKRQRKRNPPEHISDYQNVRLLNFNFI